MQQIYKRTPIPECDFSKVAIKITLWQQLYGNQTFAWVFSCKLAAYFQSTFSYEHLWTAGSESVRFNNDNAAS